MRSRSQQGLVLTLAITTILLIMSVAGAALTLAYNQRLLTDDLAAQRTRSYWYAQAGVVDAQWRIRTNFGGNYAPAMDPAAYSIDVDGDGDNDVTVDIGVENSTTRLRPIVVNATE